MSNQFIIDAWNSACHIQKELETKGTITLDTRYLAVINTIVNLLDSKL